MAAVGIAEEIGSGKEPQQTRTGKGTRKPRLDRPNDTGNQRFFLAKRESGTSVPELGKECASESEAILDSFKGNLPYFVVCEYRGVADLSKKKVELRREPVGRTPPS
jgi:hypothetical protein